MPTPIATPNTSSATAAVPSEAGCRQPRPAGAGVGAGFRAEAAGSASRARSVAAASASYRARRSAKSASETWPAACSKSSSRSAASATRLASVSCSRSSGGSGSSGAGRSRRRTNGQNVKAAAGTASRRATTTALPLIGVFWWGAPTWPPTPPHARTRSGGAVARLGSSVCLQLAPDALAHGGVHRRRRRRGATPARPAARQQRHDAEADGDRGHREAPDDQVEPRAARRQEDPFTVARDEVLPHLLRRLARFEPLAHDRAHLRGHLRRRVRDRQVLAHHAAQLRGHVVDGLLGDGHRRTGARDEQERAEGDHERARDARWHPRCTPAPRLRRPEEKPMTADTFLRDLVTQLEPNATVVGIEEREGAYRVSVTGTIGVADCELPRDEVEAA